jgi:hypothetical protein
VGTEGLCEIAAVFKQDTCTDGIIAYLTSAILAWTLVAAIMANARLKGCIVSYERPVYISGTSLDRAHLVLSDMEIWRRIEAALIKGSTSASSDERRHAVAAT